MMPNLVMENPANGHAHAAWVLAAPVCRTDVARLKPLKLTRSVTEGLRCSCDGDTGYAGLLMKNPLSGAWSSEITAPDAYALDQLRAALEEHGDMPPASWKRTKRARTVGLGRNCTLFDEARTLAYRYVRSLPDRTPESGEMLREHVRATCHQLNAELFADLAARTRGRGHRQEHPQVDNHAQPHVARRGRGVRGHLHRHAIRTRPQGRAREQA